MLLHHPLVGTLHFLHGHMDKYVYKTTSSITIKAKATDAQNDALTYTMYVSTDNTNWTQKATSSSVSSGTEVTLTANGLAEYTNYYWKIDVSDTLLDSTHIANIPIKTLCSRNRC